MRVNLERDELVKQIGGDCPLERWRRGESGATARVIWSVPQTLTSKQSRQSDRSGRVSSNGVMLGQAPL